MLRSEFPDHVPSFTYKITGRDNMLEVKVKITKQSFENKVELKTAEVQATYAAIDPSSWQAARRAGSNFATFNLETSPARPRVAIPLDFLRLRNERDDLGFHKMLFEESKRCRKAFFAGLFGRGIIKGAPPCRNFFNNTFK